MQAVHNIIIVFERVQIHVVYLAGFPAVAAWEYCQQLIRELKEKKNITAKITNKIESYFNTKLHYTTYMSN